jgi:hypothetical protein
MDEGIVECCQDVADAKIVFGLFSSTSGWGSVVSYFLLLFGSFSTFGISSTLLSLLLSF